MINKVINGLSLVGELVKSAISDIKYNLTIELSSSDQIALFHLHTFQYADTSCLSFRPEFDMFNDSFEELIVVELKSPLYFECILLSHVLRIRNTK
jgi:hypothetical protein